MRRAVICAAVVAVLVSLLGAAPALGRPPLRVHIEVTTSILTPGPHPFVATGPAVDGDLMCATGSVFTGAVSVAPSPDGENLLLLTVLQHFVCAGGDFNVELQVTLDLITHYTWGSWHIVGATGVLAGITGNGRIKGTPIVVGESILDVYDGKISYPPVLDVHIDAPTPLPAGAPIPFTASGPAVARGLISASGTVATGPITWSASTLGDRYATLSMTKYFVCAGGTFDVYLVVTLDNWTGSTYGNWRVLRGTGSCADLKGNGTLSGNYVEPEVKVYDVYDGRLRN